MLRALVLLILMPFAALAQDYPAPLSDKVNDWAGVLSPEAAARLEGRLQTARDETGVHVVLVTMKRLADHGGAGMRIDSYAKGLFNAWGVGDKTRNDGVLILVATGDREIRVALGAGYDAVWDNAAQAAIDRGFLPEFRAGRIEAGIEAGVDQVITRIARPFAAGQPAEVVPDAGLPLPLLGLGIGAVLLLALRQRIGDGWQRFARCPSCGHRGLERTTGETMIAGTTTPGEGWRLTRCPSCGHERRETLLIRTGGFGKGDSQGDSGSSGFGGGRSSGGGASGRW